MNRTLFIVFAGQNKILLKSNANPVKQARLVQRSGVAWRVFQMLIWIICCEAKSLLHLTSDKNMSGGLSRQQLEKFEKDGVLIIEDFLTKEEVSSIRNVLKHDMQTTYITLYDNVGIPAVDYHVKHKDRHEIHEIVEKLDPLTDRGVFSTTGCQQVQTSHYNSVCREERRELL